eukprot:Anaeramoba_ignava/a347490_159.p1 GENE.a347490_159~~a347490_159.p1  ORF type:complete len:438 (+),score=116.39 a347490_159:28-1314(+)
MKIGLILFVFLIIGFIYGYDWTPVDQVLENALNEKAFPGCTALVGSSEGVIYAKPFGYYTYGLPAPVTHTNPAVQMDTMYDLASLTKVVATTTAVMQFYQRGELDLNTKLIDPKLLGEKYNNNGKDQITVRNLLLHNAGFPPDPVPNYWNKTFGCPEAQKYYPPEDFNCRAKIYSSVMTQTLIYPTGSKYIYSDLSMITMMYVVGKLAHDLKYITPEDLDPICVANSSINVNDLNGLEQCYYEAYVRIFVLSPLNTQRTMFRPDVSLWGDCSPTENDTWFRHQVIEGFVHDENAYIMGGISGHAGLFSISQDLGYLMEKLVFAPEDSNYVNKTTVELFTTIYNETQSSRALGWDTNLYNYFCGDLSQKTFCHTGFTGTSICADPTRKLYAILLSARVYPTRDNYLIGTVRTQFANAVKQVFDQDEKNN